jgi:rhodanese-related sulfurtransferase
MDQVIEFAGNHPYLVGALIGLLVFAIVTEIRLRAGGSEVSPAEAVKLINDGARVVDIRPAAQFQKGHIVGAINVPIDQLGQQASGIAKRKDRLLLVCCDSGLSAGKAARELRKADYSSVAKLRGGIAAWQRDNLPLEHAKSKPGNKSKKR